MSRISPFIKVAQIANPPPAPQVAAAPASDPKDQVISPEAKSLLIDFFTAYLIFLNKLMIKIKETENKSITLPIDTVYVNNIKKILDTLKSDGEITSEDAAKIRNAMSGCLPLLDLFKTQIAQILTKFKI